MEAERNLVTERLNTALRKGEGSGNKNALAHINPQPKAYSEEKPGAGC